MVDMICEGPIQGLVNAKNSVYINDIPFETSNVVGTLTSTNSTNFSTPLVNISAGGTAATIVDNTYEAKDSDIGKYVVVSVKKCAVTLTINTSSWPAIITFVTMTGTGGVNTLDSDFTTVGDTDSYIVLESAAGVRYTVDGNFYGAGGSHPAGGTAGLSVPVDIYNNTFINNSSWTATLVVARKIQSLSVDSNTGADVLNLESSVSSTALTNASFYIEGARVTDTSASTSSEDTTAKVEGSTLQFRTGELGQAPIQQVHGVSGGVTVTGAGAGKAIRQVAAGYGFTALDTGGYPDTVTYTNASEPPFEISSSGGSAPNFNLTAAQRREVDEVVIRINYPQLITYNNKGGDKESASAHYVFQVALSQDGGATFGSWKTLFSQSGGKVVHTARTTAPISFDHTIGLARFRPFDDFKIRIIRLTRDLGLPVWTNGTNGGRTDKDEWSLQASASISGADLQATIKDSFSYPFTAHAAISFSSKTYNSLPSRSYLLRGLKVRIPSSYTPREYTEDGIARYDTFWDGDFKKEGDKYLLYYTDNPAWVFYDIVSNNRYGAGKWIDSNFINKFALYRIAKYCDELVEDGSMYSLSGTNRLVAGNFYKIKEVGNTSWTSAGANSNEVGIIFKATSDFLIDKVGKVAGLEPRFRANIFLTKSTDVYKVLKDMASVFTGMLYWLDGKITPVQDVPGDPVYTFSKANVIDGVFNYESTGRKTRANQVVVTWNDPKANYEPVPLIVEDQEDIVKSKRLVTENAVAMGATSEGQAKRYGRWKLWTAQNQKEVVSFKTGLQGGFIRPGDVINVQDRDRYGVDYSGLIKETQSSTEILLDRQITNITNGVTWTISTLVTKPAAFYTGAEPIRIDANGHKVTTGGTLYQRGDRFTGKFFVPPDRDNIEPGSLTSGTGMRAWLAESTGGSDDIYDVNSETAETLVSNAHILVKNDDAFSDDIEGNSFTSAGSSSSTVTGVYSPEILPLEWAPHTFIVTKDVNLTSGTPDFTTVGGLTKVTVSTAYSAFEQPVAGTVWALQSSDAEGTNILGSKKEYRVLGIVLEDEKNQYSISAVEHYNAKYDAVDIDYALGATPSNVFPIIEDPDEDVPAPGNIYVVLETDSTKPGEEIRLEWTKPVETYTNSAGNIKTRDYSFFSEYELHHNIPDIESPIRTTTNYHSFIRVPDGYYTFRVRTVSRKQNYSDFIATEYLVDDPFATDVERVIGGLPKGLIANSTFYKVSGANSLDYESVHRLEWEKSTPVGHSVGSEFTLSSQSSSISASLNDIPLYGLVNNGFPRAEYSPSSHPANTGVDGTAPDSAWHYLLFDGGNCTLAHWNTTTLDGLPFMFKIPELGDAEINYTEWVSISGYRGASQSWTSAGNMYQLTAGTNKLKGNGTSWNTSTSSQQLLPRDIIHFDGVGSDGKGFAHFKIDDLSLLGSKQTLELDLRALFEDAGSGIASKNINIKDDLYWQDGDIVSFERVKLSNGNDSSINGQNYYIHVDYHDGLTPSQYNRALLYKTYEAAVDPDSIEESAGTFTAQETYTILTVGNTAWSAIGGPASPSPGDTFTATGPGSGTGVAIASKHLVSSSDLGGTFQDYTGYVYRTKIKAAKVTAVLNNTTVLLDRSFEENITPRTIYRLTYRLGYNNDAVFGRVKWTNYDSSAGSHQFALDKFITVDPGLEVGGLQVIVTPSTSVLQYNADGTTQITNVNGDITAKIDAIGFKNPQFRITEVDGGGSGVDKSPVSPTWNNPTNSGGFFYSEVIATGSNPNESDNIPFEQGDPLVITAEVRESKAIDINAFGTGQITKVTSGSDGIDGKTVHLVAEDYSIIYDEGGANPSLNGSDRTITFTAEAFNFTNPKFKWTAIEDFTDDTSFTFNDSGASYSWGTFKANDSGTGNEFISTATIEIPTTYIGKWNNTKLQKQFTVKVEVAEEDASSTLVEAFDEVSVIGVHAGNGGKWVILSNPSHTVATNGAGSIDVAHDPNTNQSGFATAPNSGTTIEVGRGGKVLSPYTVTVNNQTVQGSETDWNDLSAENKENKYFIKYTENANAYLNKGTVTFNGDLTVLGDHEFSINGWTADTASLGIQVFCEETTGSSNGINISQGFTKSKAGFGGIAVINSNSFESLPVDKNNNVLSNSTFDAYSLTATTINVFMGGVNLPYYGTSTAEVTAIGTDKPAAYWQYTQHDNGVNIDVANENTYTYPSSSNRYAALAIPAASAMLKTQNTASITWTLTVYVRNDSNTYTSETVTTTQRIVKNKNSANISAYTTVGHYSFDADNLTVESPATGYSINWNTTVPEGANAYVTLEGGPLASATKQTGSSYGPQSAPDYETSGTLNYPITFTAKLYNFDDGGNSSNVPTSADLLDVDTVTISASKSAVDDVVMELDNDNETVGGSTGVDIGDTSATVVTTTATMFVNGNDDTSNWTFAVSTLPSTLTGSLSGASNDGPTLNITKVDKTFTSAQITITASRNNYTDHQKVFTLTRVNDQATFKILSDHSAVTYNPNTSGYNPGDATVDFSFVKIENGQSSAFTGGAYKINGGNAVLNSSSVSHQFTGTQASSVNVKLYSDTSATQLVDEETVPLIIGGSNAQFFSISPSSQVFTKAKDGSYTPSSISFTANKSNIAGNVSWSGATFYSEAALTNTVNQGDTVYIGPSALNSGEVTITGAVGSFSDSEVINELIDGSDNITATLSNDNVTFTAATNGTVSSFAGSGTNIRVFEGTTALTFEVDNTTTNANLPTSTWKMSRTPTGVTVAGITSGSYDAYDGDTTVTTPNITAMGGDTGSISWNITAKKADGSLVTLSAVQTFSKAKQGDTGAAGRTFSISPSHQVVVKNAAGTTITPAAVQFTHSKTNMGTGDPTWSSTSDLYAAATGGSALSGAGLIRPNVYVRPLTSDTSVTVEADLSFDSTALSDTESVEVVQDGLVGADAIVVSLSNDNVTFTAASNGAVSSYTGSGTNISVYEGATKLSFSTTSPQPNGTWTVSASGSGITKGSGPTAINSTAPYDAEFADASGMANATNSATITFSISGKTADGTAFTASKVQNFSKALQGPAGSSVTGNPGPRSVFAYIYYQSSTGTAPDVPALSKFTPDFSNGSVGSSDLNWSTNSPTFAAGNTNKYWYFTFTATEGGTYNNGYPSSGTTKDSSPDVGQDCIQGIGFSGLVTFSSTNNIDGFNPIKWINDNGATTGTSNTTTIDGGLIRTNTIIASKLAFTPITSIAGETGSTVTTSSLSTALSLGALANQNAINLSNQVSGTLGLGAGGTGSATGPFGYATSTGFITGAGITLLTDVFANSSKTGISSNFTTQITAAKIFMSNSIATGSSSGLTVTNTNELSLDTTAITLTSTQVGLGSVANKNEADQVKGAFTSVTAITAGSINLKSGSAGIDISAANQRITITDTNGVTRVKLGQL